MFNFKLTTSANQLNVSVFRKSQPPANAVHLKPTKGADRKRASGAEVCRARTKSVETTATVEADR